MRAGVGTRVADESGMQPTTAVGPVAQGRARVKRPTASMVDGNIDITVFDVLELHELFDHARVLLRPIARMRGVRAISMLIRARDTARGGAPAVEIEVQVRTAAQPISIRCVRPTAHAALELAAIVLRLRLSSSDKQSDAAE